MGVFDNYIEQALNKFAQDHNIESRFRDILIEAARETQHGNDEDSIAGLIALVGLLGLVGGPLGGAAGILTGAGKAGLLGAGGFLAGFGVQLMSGYLTPGNKIQMYEADSWIHSFRLPPDIAIPAAWRNPADKDYYFNDLNDLGIDEKRRQIIDAIKRPVLPPNALISLARRGRMSAKEADDLMKWQGMTDRQIELAYEATKIYPGVQDLIQFAVRDAYKPEVIEKYGYAEDLPETFLIEAEKAGYPVEDAKRAWYTHWQLPSPQLAFEMYWRLRPGRTNYPFTGEDLAEFLRIADYPKYFRDRLIEVSRPVIRLVDIRRFARSGVIAPEEVYEQYLDRGYSPELANAYAMDTLADAHSEELDTLRKHTLDLFEKGAMTYEDTFNALERQGYSTSLIGLWLDSIDYERAEKIRQQELDYVHDLYVGGELSETDVYNRALPLAGTTEEVTRLLKYWDIEKKKKEKKPTEVQLKNWYFEDIIDESEYLLWLKRLHWNDINASRILRESINELQELRRKQEDEARIKAETEQTSKLTNDYNKQKALLEWKKTTLKSRIATLKLALLFAVDGEEELTIKANIGDAAVTIADVDNKIAGLKATLLTQLP